MQTAILLAAVGLAAAACQPSLGSSDVVASLVLCDERRVTHEGAGRHKDESLSWSTLRSRSLTGGLGQSALDAPGLAFPHDLEVTHLPLGPGARTNTPT